MPAKGSEIKTLVIIAVLQLDNCVMLYSKNNFRSHDGKAIFDKRRTPA